MIGGIVMKEKSIKICIFLVIFAACFTLMTCDTSEPTLMVEAAVTVDNSTHTATAAIMTMQGFMPVDDATITVNGEDFSGYFFILRSLSNPPYNAGASITLNVQRGNVNITKTLTIPANDAIITKPLAADDPYSKASPITVLWNHTLTALDYQIAVSSSYTTDEDGYSATVPAASISTSIPGNIFDATTTAAILTLSKSNTTVLDGEGLSMSYFGVSHSAKSEMFDLTD